MHPKQLRDLVLRRQRAQTANDDQRQQVSWRRARDYRNAEAPKPSAYLRHLEALLADRPTDAPPLPVVPYCRVSTRQQEDAGNLDREVEWLTGELARLPVVLVTEAYTDVAPAYPYTDEHCQSKPDRPQLRLAAMEAQRLDAVVVAACADRFVRNVRWWVTGGNDGGCLPDAGDFEELRGHTLGVQLATVCHPDDNAAGMAWGTPGRPPKRERPKDRRARLLEDVRAMHAEGKTPGTIAKVLGLSRSTVWDWINKAT